MRWLGNKTSLLEEIYTAAKKAGYQGGTVCDLFAGSGSVGRFFRSQGCRVVSTDLMNCSHVFQKAYLETSEVPRFDGIKPLWETLDPVSESRLSQLRETGEAWLPFRKLVNYLETVLPPEQGLLYRQFSKAGESERNYLTPENAARLDAILACLRKWRVAGDLKPQEIWLLLASCIDAADRVANISGTYGAYLKTVQGSALRHLELKVPAIVDGPIGEGHRKDALDWISEVECELLYIDPPYNQRQYPANYHLPEILSLLPFESSDDRIEDSIYGKTGLIPWKEKASPLCSRRGDDCFQSVSQLIKSAKAEIIIFSYSEEGILQREELESILQDWAGCDSEKGLSLLEIPYRRFRSDSGSNEAVKRTFRPAPGRSRDEVHEWLFVASKVVSSRDVKELQ